MDINIILPYKETYSEKLAGAVSLLVAEVKNQSKYKKLTFWNSISDSWVLKVSVIWLQN